jgi:hypothetical protein
VGAASAPTPPGVETLELQLGEPRQLFFSLDPAPFRERSLDPKAEEYIVEWARDQRRDVALGLVIGLERGTHASEEAALLPDAITASFRARATSARRRLADLLRVGRTSLVIGLGFNALMLILADQVGSQGYGILHDSLVIGGWVAMWRPIEIFLYDWWPIHGEIRLAERLAAMPVQVKAAGAA